MLTSSKQGMGINGIREWYSLFFDMHPSICNALKQLSGST
jgi:hypothetical protein